MRLNFKQLNPLDEYFFYKKVWNVILCILVCGSSIDEGEQWKLYCIHKEIIEEVAWHDIFGTYSPLFLHWNDST